MGTKSKAICGGVGVVVVLALAILLLPRLARRIDASFDPLWEKSAALEAQYRDMTNAYPSASELAPDHPTAQLWLERKAALLQAGYIESRELQMRHSLAQKDAVRVFFAAFHARFPGVECSVRNAKSDAPLVVVTARKSDFGTFGAIEQFVIHDGSWPCP